MQLGNFKRTQGSFIVWSGGSANSRKPLAANCAVMQIGHLDRAM